MAGLPPSLESLQAAAQDLPCRAAKWKHGSCTQPELAALLRVLRNAPAAGPAAVQAVLHSAVHAIVAAAQQVLLEPSSSQELPTTVRTGTGQAQVLTPQTVATQPGYREGTAVPEHRDQVCTDAKVAHTAALLPHTDTAQQKATGHQDASTKLASTATAPSQTSVAPHQQWTGQQQWTQPQWTGQQPVPDTQLCTLIAQALANFSAASPAGAAWVWQVCQRNLLATLLAHPADKVHDPTTMLLYQCCKHVPAAEAEMATQSCHHIWWLLLRRAMGLHAGASCSHIATCTSGTATTAAQETQQQQQEASSTSARHLASLTSEPTAAAGFKSVATAGVGGASRQVWIHDCMSDTSVDINELELSAKLQPEGSTGTPKQQHAVATATAAAAGESCTNGNQAGGGLKTAPNPAMVSDWLTLLVGHLCIKQGHLSIVLHQAAHCINGRDRAGDGPAMCNVEVIQPNAVAGAAATVAEGSTAVTEGSTAAAATATGGSTTVSGDSTTAAEQPAQPCTARDCTILLNSPAVPFTLHVIAHELKVMKGSPPTAGAEKSDAQVVGESAQSFISLQSSGWGRCLLDLLYVMQQAAHACAHAAKQGSTARAVAVGVSNTLQSTAVTSSEANASPDMAAAVLEASLECLKSVAMCDDLGMRLTGDPETDVVSLLCDQQQLVLRLLGVLSCLQPIQNPRRAAREAAAAGQASIPYSPFLPDSEPYNSPRLQHQGSVATDTMHAHDSHAHAASVHPAAPSAATIPSAAAAAAAAAAPDGASTSALAAPAAAAARMSAAAADVASTTIVSAGAQCRAALPCEFTHLLPEQQPYMGYRGDILAVLANVMHGRPAVADQVARVPGAVLLILAQCQLDESSPLAKEWAMWAIRNMCAGSAVAVRQIQELQPVAAVQNDDMKAMGLELQLDSDTGKFKVVNVQTQQPLKTNQG